MKKTVIALLLMNGLVQAATVSSVSVSIDNSTKMVTVTYTLSDAGAYGATVTMSASANGGVSWDVPVVTTYGDIGTDVMNGAGKRIFWDAGRDWPDNVSSNMQVRILAANQSTNSSAMYAQHPDCRLPVTGCKTDILEMDNDDGELQLGRPFSFTDNGNGTVTDNNTGLMWVKDLTGPACSNGVPMTWPAATNWVKKLTFAGYNDWRIADYYEIIMIADFDKDMYSCMPSWLIQSKRKAYWTSGWDRGLATNVPSFGPDRYATQMDLLLKGMDSCSEILAVDAQTKYTNATYVVTNYAYSTISNNIMLVRGSDLTAPQYDGSPTLWKDTNNHLQWGIVISNQVNEVGCGYGNSYPGYGSYFDCAKEANDVVWKGYSNWRRPNIKELMTLAQMIRKNGLNYSSSDGDTCLNAGSSTARLFRQNPCGGMPECLQPNGVRMYRWSSTSTNAYIQGLYEGAYLLVRTYE